MMRQATSVVDSMTLVYLFPLLLYTLLGSHSALAQSEHTNIENQVITYNISKDGSQSSEEMVRFSAVDDQGRRDLAVQRVIFDPTQMDVEILEAGVDSDGKSTPITVAGLKPVKAQHSNTSPGISNMLVFEIPFGEIRIGSAIWYKIRRKSKPGTSVRPFEMAFIYGVMSLEKRGSIDIVSDLPLFHDIYDPDGRLKVSEFKKDEKFNFRIELLKPTQSIVPKDLAELTDEQILFRVPRAIVTTAPDWAFISKSNSVLYKVPAMPAEPADIKKLVKDLIAIKTPTEKAAKVLGWIADNFTYSGRWTNRDSGLQPRSIDEILKSKVGDCKDFALLALTLFKIAGLEAEPVYTSLYDPRDRLSLLAKPIHPDKVLPSMAYFNHVVVRYQDGKRWITIDPTRGLSDSTRTPYFLDGAWSLNLNAANEPAYKIKLPEVGYAKISATTTLIRKPDLGFSGVTEVNVSGEAANILRMIYFSGGAKAVSEIIKRFNLSGESETPAVGDFPELDRSSDSLKFNISFSAAAFDEKRPYQLPTFAFQNGLLPPIPLEIENQISLSDSYAPVENKYDCLVRGPYVSWDRRIENVQKTVVTKDRLHFKSIASATSNPWNLKIRSSINIGAYQSCVAAGQVSIQPGSKVLPTQKTFDDMIYSKEGFFRNPAIFVENEKVRTEIRRLDAYIKRDIPNPDLWHDRGRNVRMLGYSSGNDYSLEYLEESLASFSKAIEIDPKYAPAYGQRGLTYFFMEKRLEARREFNAGYKINPTDADVLFLGGALELAADKFESAAGYYAASAKNARTVGEKAKALTKQADILAGKLGRPIEGAKLYEIAMKLEPDFAWHPYNASIIYMDLKDYDKAIALLHQAIKIREFGSATHNLKYCILEYSDELIKKGLPEKQKARDLLLEAYKLDREDIDVVGGLALVHVAIFNETKNTQDALAAVQYQEELMNNKGVKIRENSTLVRNVIDSISKSNVYFAIRKPANR